VSEQFLLPDQPAQPAAPQDGGDGRAKSSYSESRRNATTHGMRCETVFPKHLEEVIQERIAAFIADKPPRTHYEAWAITELARATALVEHGDMLLREDEVRIIHRVSGPRWQADAEEKADVLAERMGRRPNRTVRALERTKQGTQLLLDRLRDLADIVRSKNCLNEAQRTLLFDVVGVPLPLRDGNRRVPAADNAPALLNLITGEIARHEANLVNTLNQRDRDDQQDAVRCPSTYIDNTRRQLRSDHARALKRLYWAQQVLDQLRSGVHPSTIIDPRTKQPINPTDRNPPAPKRGPAAAGPSTESATPTPTPTPTHSPTPTSAAVAEPSEEQAANLTVAPVRFRFPAGWPVEVSEALMVGAEAMQRASTDGPPDQQSSP
jgi:hypothetical protein